MRTKKFCISSVVERDTYRDAMIRPGSLLTLFVLAESEAVDDHQHALVYCPLYSAAFHSLRSSK
jgi:hypothetical protein